MLQIYVGPLTLGLKFCQGIWTDSTQKLFWSSSSMWRLVAGLINNNWLIMQSLQLQYKKHGWGTLTCRRTNHIILSRHLYNDTSTTTSITVIKIMPIHSIHGKHHINNWKQGKAIKLLQSISHYIMPCPWGGHTHIQTCEPAVLRNQMHACHRPMCI